MSVGLRGIRVARVSIDKEDKISGAYELVSTADKVLATQPFGDGYGTMEISTSPATAQALSALKASIQADISALIGLEGVGQ